MNVLPQVVTHRGGRPDEVGRQRRAWADNLKVVLVAGVIVAHATMAWTGVGNWVFRETQVREPLLTLLTLVAALGALFGMSLFFLIAGYFTPRSLERKGLRRFILDRVVRLLVPMLVFVVLLSPPIEYVDPDNAGWTHGFWAFVPEILWPPAPGPTWFLGVLFLFSVAYACLRTCRRRRGSAPRPLRLSQLGVLALAIAGTSFLIRTETPLGEEHLAPGAGPGTGMGGRIRPRRARCRTRMASARGWTGPLHQVDRLGRPVYQRRHHGACWGVRDGPGPLPRPRNLAVRPALGGRGRHSRDGSALARGPVLATLRRADRAVRSGAGPLGVRRLPRPPGRAGGARARGPAAALATGGRRISRSRRSGWPSRSGSAGSSRSCPECPASCDASGPTQTSDNRAAVR